MNKKFWFKTFYLSFYTFYFIQGSFFSPSDILFSSFPSVLVTHVKNYFCDVSFSKPFPRSESWENGVPRIGPRTSTALFALVWKPLHDLNP